MSGHPRPDSACPRGEPHDPQNFPEIRKSCRHVREVFAVIREAVSGQKATALGFGETEKADFLSNSTPRRKDARF
jgi:hypothetical protein